MKTLCFIPEFISHDYGTIYLKLIIVFAAISMVILAMVIDFYFGLKKAKKLGESSTSEGFRRSTNKFVYYGAVMLFALIFDVLNVLSAFFPSPLNLVPIITLGAAVALILTEFKSVREKAEDKARRKSDESIRQLLAALKDKDVLFQALKGLEGLSEKNKKEE